MHQIVFLTLYLGLVSGTQPVELQADAAVKTIRLLLDGTPVRTMAAPPWRTVIDVGPEPRPRELVAAGYDAEGKEIARASQLLNVPRPTAELDIVLTRNAAGQPESAALTGRHMIYAAPKRATLTLDEHPLALDRNRRAPVPAVDMKRPHVLSAEMRFEDGAVARRELVFGGQFGETMPAQLSAVALLRTGASDAPPADGCVVANDGAALHVAAVESSNPLVLVVRDPDGTEINAALLRRGVSGGSIDTAVTRHVGTLEPGSSMQIFSSVATRTVVAGQPTAILFPSSPLVDASRGGLYWLLTRGRMTSGNPAGPRQWADAVAVAGVNAVASARRRAVILVAGSAADGSGHSVAGIRRYLASLGVPLFVWSVTGPRPELADTWGAVDDVSTLEKMNEAAERLRAALDAQRIAWIEADPLTALRARVKDGCGYAALAR